MWDNMDQWQAEMEEMKTQIPALQTRIEDLEAQLAEAKRKTWAHETYKAADPEGSVSYEID